MASVFLYETTAPLVPWYERPALEPETVKSEDAVDEAEEVGAQADEGDYLSLGSDSASLEDFKEAKEEEVEEETAVVSGAAAGAASTPWSFADGQSPQLRSPLLQLHEEVVRFAAIVSPTPAEEQERKEALERVEEVVHYIWPQASVKVFGSYATGLYLPTSDCDVVVMGSGAPSPVDALRALGRALVQRKVASKLQVVAKARIPIAKFLETRSGISFDISFEQASGPEAVSYVQAALASSPALRPLCLVLKTFLQQRDLNEVYRGGLGSYALLVMLMAHQRVFQREMRARGSRRRERHAAMNLGALLLDFLDLYGRRLNVRDVGVAAHAGGRFFRKEEQGMEQPDRPWNLCVLDPQAPENDVARGSFNFASVRRAFVHAHGQLAEGLRGGGGGGRGGGGGALQRMIREAPHLSSRACTLPAGRPGEGAREEAAPAPEGRRAKKRKAERERVEAAEEGEPGTARAGDLEAQGTEGHRRRHRHKRSPSPVAAGDSPEEEGEEELEEGEHEEEERAGPSGRAAEGRRGGQEGPELSRRQQNRLRRRDAAADQALEIAEEKRQAAQKERKMVNGRMDVTQLRVWEQGKVRQSGRGREYVEPQDTGGFGRDYGGGSTWQGRPQQQYGHHSWDQRRRQWHGR